MEMIKLETKLPNNINVLVTGCSVSKALRTILERIREQNEASAAMNIADKLGMTVEEYADEIKSINDYPKSTYELLKKLSDLYDDSFIPKESIPNLKRRIKYCKNPMERKKLQQELNLLYKEQKGRNR